MTWFRYFKESVVLNENEASTNYSYPLVKRSLPRFVPTDDIPYKSWLTVPVSGLNVGKYMTADLQQEIDHSSYLLVYENVELNVFEFTPIRCFIDNDILYFQTSSDHPANKPIDNQYSLYYHTKDIHYVDFAQNGPVSEDDKAEFQVNKSNLTFFGQISDIDGFTNVVTISSVGRYNFSFVNSGTDWDQGSTAHPGAKMYLSFPGPKFELYGAKGPDFGKIKVKLTGLSNEENPISEIIFSDLVIDCYNANYKENELLFSSVGYNFTFRDYVMEIQVINDKNLSSTGNKFKVNRFRFNYNIYTSFGQEQISEFVALSSSGMFKGRSSASNRD